MARRRRPRPSRQRGVALVAVTAILTMTGVLAHEFSTTSQTDALGADNHRDQMLAEQLARSSLNLSELILRLQQVLDNPQIQEQIGKVQLTDYASMFMMAFGGTAEEVASTTGLAGDAARGFGAEIGYFDVRITTDDNKININCANGKPEFAQLIYTYLDGLYYFPVFDRLFQDPDADGWRRDRRQQTEALVDYVDADRQKAPIPGDGPSGASEDYGYESLPDHYKAKNNYLDTIAEIKLIRGVDERFWALFGHRLTVYGGCKINVRALDDPGLIATLLYLTAKNREDPVLRDGTLLWYHALAVSWARQNGLPFDTTQEFVDFVKDPEGKVQDMLGALGGVTGGGAQPPPQLQIPGVPVGIDLGLELDLANVNKALRAGPQRTYRVVATGQVDRSPPFAPVRREITAVWDMGNVNANQRSQDAKARNGSWVYLKTH
jgi:type II secretory pathway component PulK